MMSILEVWENTKLHTNTPLPPPIPFQPYLEPNHSSLLGDGREVYGENGTSINKNRDWIG
jgi:hypothetical protein